MRSTALSWSARAAAAALCLASATVAFAQAPFVVSSANGRLSVHADNAPLADVVADAAQKTHIEIADAEKLAGTITVDFTGLLPAEAMAKLLADVNYVVQARPAAERTDPDDSGFVIRIHSMANGATPEPTAAPASRAIRIPSLDALSIREAQDEADDEQD